MNGERVALAVLANHERAEIQRTFPDIGYRYRQRPDIRVLLYATSGLPDHRKA